MLAVFITIGIFVFFAFKFVYPRSRLTAGIYYGRKWAAWVFAFLPLVGMTGANPALTGDYGAFIAIVVVSSIYVLPVYFAGWVRGKLFSKEKFIEEKDVNLLSGRVPADHETQNQAKNTLSIVDQIVKKGAVGQTAKSLVKVFNVMKPGLPDDDLHAILSATLDFRYAANRTKSNMVRHQHITESMADSLDSEATYGLKNLVMSILEQEMDIVGIEHDVEKVVVEVLRESGISYSDLHGTDDVEQFGDLLNESSGNYNTLKQAANLCEPMSKSVNEKQKKILLVVAVTVIGMLLYPPYHMAAGEGGYCCLEYSFLFSPPAGLSLDFATLLTQWLGVLIAGRLVFMLFSD